MSWDVSLAPEVHDWFVALDDLSVTLVRDAVELLMDRGPTLGRPMADKNLQRRAVFLVARDKAGSWTRWYRDAIKLAEYRYARYLATPPEEIQ